MAVVSKLLMLSATSDNGTQKPRCNSQTQKIPSNQTVSDTKICFGPILTILEWGHWDFGGSQQEICCLQVKILFENSLTFFSYNNCCYAGSALVLFYIDAKENINFTVAHFVSFMIIRLGNSTIFWTGFVIIAVSAKSCYMNRNEKNVNVAGVSV